MNQFELRPYQKTALEKLMWAKDLPGNDLVCLAQGSGKSIVIAELANRLNEPVLVLCPNKEILEQNIDKMERYINRNDIGVYSASMNEKTIKPITFGTVQSMYRHPDSFKGFKVAIMDEADLHSPKNINGMTNKLFKEAGIQKVFGFTGTPYRMEAYYERWGGLPWQVDSITTTKIITRMKPFFWRRMLYVVNTDVLMFGGYLTPLEYIDVSLYDHDDLPTNKSMTDFDLEKVDDMIVDKYGDIADYISVLPHQSKLVFCASVKQAEALQQLIKGSMVVTSNTTRKEREKAVSDLHSGRLRVLLNVGIYTVGFDYPELDCLIILRPTQSLRLHSQILGRASRIYPGKEKAYVYDLAGNIKKLGTLESIRVTKVEGKWDVVSDTKPMGWHYVPLYRHRLKEANGKKG